MAQETVSYDYPKMAKTKMATILEFKMLATISFFFPSLFASGMVWNLILVYKIHACA